MNESAEEGRGVTNRGKPNIPRVVQGTDLRSLPIGPLEGFVLTRIDGGLSIPALADMTGQPEEQVRAAVDKLVSLGAVEWVDASPSDTAAAEPLHPEHPEFGVADTVPPASGEASPSPEPAAAAADGPIPYDPAELEEDVGLPRERRKLILDMYYRLDDLDYYALLGVARDADKKEVRAAYFALSKQFHPDTLFGRHLGSFKPKMEKVFHQLTQAYETLGRKKQRASYDEYLGLLDATRAAERRMDETNEQAAAIEREAVSAHVHPSETESAVHASGVVSQPPAPRPSMPGPRPSSEVVRRQLFARRLTAARRPGASAPPASEPAPHVSSMPPRIVPPSEARREVLRGLAQSLKDSARHTGGHGDLDESLQEARRAEAEGDLVEAANALRLALALAPDDAEIQQEYERVHHRLAKGLAETYEKQALYEENNGKWAAASVSWKRVAEGRPGDAEPHRRAAQALLQAEGDLRLARNFAQKAVDLQPNNVRNRVVLGQIYRAAGMNQSALREAERAATLDPDDEIVKNLLRELQA